MAIVMITIVICEGSSQKPGFWVLGLGHWNLWEDMTQALRCAHSYAHT